MPVMLPLKRRLRSRSRTAAAASRDAGDEYREEERGQPCEQEIDQGGLEHLFERCVDNAGGEIEQRLPGGA